MNETTETKELPTSLAGYQRLAENEITQQGDIAAFQGLPCWFLPPNLLGRTVEGVESCREHRVYRKIAVAKQGDLDHVNFHGTSGAAAMVTLPKPILPTEAAARKKVPLYTGLMKYFPRSLCAIANLSYVGNSQHHAGTELHWDKSKSSDEADALMRHLLESGKVDTDGVRHSIKVGWRALALLERELEAAEKASQT